VSSSFGDDMREHRQWMQARKKYWHECPDCKVSFGTGTSTPPGGTCRNCGWAAPGERGSDVRAAQADRAAEKERKRRKSARPRWARRKEGS